MAITRRQFVTTLSALAAAMGVGQADLTKVTEALAHGGPWAGGNWAAKPKVIWIHGAECTGCSTSVLSLFEDARGTAIEGTSITTVAALDLAVGGDGSGATVLNASTGHPFGHRTLSNSAAVTGCDFDGVATGSPYTVNIADVLIDFINLEYHETVMGMGGDLAAQWLQDAKAGVNEPFALVVEGALQDDSQGGYWGATGSAAWCSIGMADDSSFEHSMGATVKALADQDNCVAVFAYGQCATFGGYPACVSPVLGASQTGAQGTHDYLASHPKLDGTNSAGKVINVPGCPTNPWWLVLSIVGWLVDVVSPGTLGILNSDLSINPAAVDSTRRLKAVYGTPVHGPACPRYQDFLNGNFATAPGTAGCLQLIGCKGPSTNSLCAVHGWNSQQPHNDQTWDNGIAAVSGTKRGTFCVTAGHPCMGCAEKGYPDAFVPYVVR